MAVTTPVSLFPLFFSTTKVSFIYVFKLATATILHWKCIKNFVKTTSEYKNRTVPRSDPVDIHSSELDKIR